MKGKEMKIEIAETETDEGCLKQRLYIEGICVLDVYPLCESPEDAIIGRGLIDCYTISSLMRKAHRAGEQGENFYATTREWEE